MTRRFEVREGQRYVEQSRAHYAPSVWKVGAIRADNQAIPHAFLVNEQDPLQTKTISCPTLRDRVYYELIEGAPANG